MYEYNKKSFENIFLNRLDQGKLNINFYTIFLYELINNYFNSNDRYINPDMNLIKILKDSQHINYIPSEIDRNNIMHNKLNKNDKDILINKYLIEYDPIGDIQLENSVDIQEIYVPTHFSIGVTKLNDRLSKLFNFKIVKPSDKLPECINDLKNIINSKNISSADDIKNCIIKFNNDIPKY